MSGTPAEDWDSRYTASDNLFGDSPSDLLVAYRHLLKPGMSALAIGDGEGRNGVWLAEQGLHVLSVDLSPKALERARNRAAARGVALETRCADVLEWEWPLAAYDLVVCIFVHFPPGRRPAVHRAMLDALKPGGIVMLEAFHRDQAALGTGGPSDPALLYTVEELAHAYTGSEIVHLVRAATDVILDGCRKGEGSVVHLVARGHQDHALTVTGT